MGQLLSANSICRPSTPELLKDVQYSMISKKFTTSFVLSHRRTALSKENVTVASSSVVVVFLLLFLFCFVLFLYRAAQTTQLSDAGQLSPNRIKTKTTERIVKLLEKV